MILLDNIEDLLDDTGQFLNEDLRLFFEHGLTTAHGLRLLVTSRISLAFQREAMRFDRQVKLLEGLPIPDGVALLRELDPNGDYGLRNAPEQQLAQAVTLTHGVPRALEVIVGILANDPFAWLDDVLERFYEREDVVQALIEENYKRLDRGARQVIEALAVFRRPVPSLAVDYLLEPFAPGLDVPGIIWRLTRANIVSVDRATKTVTLHPIDQDYAYSRSPEEGGGEPAFTRRTLECRAADYYVQLRTPPETWRTIDDLEPQLTEFEHRIHARDYDNACQVLDAIDFEYLFLWGHYTRLVEMREKLLGQLVDSSLRATNLLCLGRAYRVLGQVERAIRLYREALITAREAGNRWAEEEILGGLGVAYSGLGEYERAIQLHKGALAIAREIGDREGQIRHLGNLGNACSFLGNIDQAITLLEEALSIAQETGDSRGKAMRLLSLGWAYHDLGQVERSIKLHEEALAISRETGHRLAEWRLLAGLGHAHYDLDQFEPAIRFYEDALAITREIGEQEGERYCLSDLGWILLAMGRLSEAHRNCAEALAVGIPNTSYQEPLVLGVVLLHQHDQAAGDTFTDAIIRCRAMLDRTADSYGPRYALAEALVGQAVCDPRWAEESERSQSLAPALTEYRRALENCSAPGVVHDAVRDLELIRSAGVGGLEPAFDLLESALA